MSHLVNRVGWPVIVAALKYRPASPVGWSSSFTSLATLSRCTGPRFVNAIRPGSDLRDVSAMFGRWRAESGYAPPSAMADRLILEIERAGRAGEHDEAVFQEERVW